MSNQGTFYGVDRKIVEAAMAKARRERSEALREIFRNLFKRSDREAKQMTPNLDAAPLAH